MFPFEFNGRQYNECTVDGSTVRPWCATSSNFTQDRQWAYCECRWCSVLIFFFSISTFPFCEFYYHKIISTSKLVGTEIMDKKNPVISYGSSSSVSVFPFHRQQNGKFYTRVDPTYTNRIIVRGCFFNIL